MSTLRSAFLIPVVLLAACGSRQSSQPATSQTPQEVPQQAADNPAGQPATPPVAVGQPLQQGEARIQPPAPGQPASGPAQGPAETAPPARDERVPSSSAPSEPAHAAPQRRWVTLPAGTTLHVRLEQTLDTKRNRSGDAFVATLSEPVFIGGEEVLPRGTRCDGHLVESKPSGRFKGRAVMSLSLDAFRFQGRSYEIGTSRFSEASGRHRKRNLVFIGGGSGFGAAVGALAAGPAGALIGAGAGAAAGTTGAALTGKKNVHLPVETRLTFVLQRPVELR